MNVQQRIIKGIRELLFTNDYLVIPGFGGFVLKTHASQFSTTKNVLLPPSKNLSFNVQLKQNDGVLVRWLQNEIHIEHENALKHILEFSDFCTGLLNSRRRLTIEELGFFYLDFENNICFEPPQDTNFLTSSYGLSPVTLKLIEPEKPKQETPSFIDRIVPAPSEKAPTKTPSRRYSRLALVVTLGLLFVGSISVLITTVGVQGPIAAGIFGGTTQGSYREITYPEIKLETYKNELPSYVSNSEGIASIELDNSKTLKVRTLKNAGRVSHVNNTPDRKHKASHGHFEIVFGCFAIQSNAQKFVRQLRNKNLNADISGVNARGMYIVGIAEFDSKSQAINELQKLKSEFPAAWIKQLP